MKVFENVKKVECRENKCEVTHANIQSEVDVEGIIMEGDSVVRGADTTITFEDGKCKKYDEVLVCKGGGF